MGDDYQRLGLQHDDMNFDDGRREEMDERSRMGIMTRDTSGFVCLFVCCFTVEMYLLGTRLDQHLPVMAVLVRDVF